jgi:xylulokinase
MDIKKIHAGMANMFLSPVFRQTLADVSGATINLYDTDGAVGAAKGAGMGAGIYKDNNEAFASLVKLGEVNPGANVEAVREAYLRWKNILTKQLEK